MDMLRFSIASASGWAYFGRKFRTNMLKFSLSKRCDSVAMVSNTMDDFPDPETPVKIVILRLGMRSETFFKLFSRAPRISIYSWVKMSLRLHCAVHSIPRSQCFAVFPSCLGGASRHRKTKRCLALGLEVGEV